MGKARQYVDPALGKVTQSFSASSKDPRKIAKSFQITEERLTECLDYAKKQGYQAALEQVLGVIGEDKPDNGNLDSQFWRNREKEELRSAIKKLMEK